MKLGSNSQRKSPRKRRHARTPRPQSHLPASNSPSPSRPQTVPVQSSIPAGSFQIRNRKPKPAKQAKLARKPRMPRKMPLQNLCENSRAHRSVENQSFSRPARRENILGGEAIGNFRAGAQARIRNHAAGNCSAGGRVKTGHRRKIEGHALLVLQHEKIPAKLVQLHELRVWRLRKHCYSKRNEQRKRKREKRVYQKKNAF